MAGAGEDHDPQHHRAGVAAALAALNGALSARIGAEGTEQVAEYIEHHEFGLALELIVALVMQHGLDGRAFDAEVERLSEAMGMGGSPLIAEWRRHLGPA